MTNKLMKMALSNQKKSTSKKTTYFVMHGVEDLKSRRVAPFDKWDDALYFAREQSDTVHVDIYKEVKETKVTLTKI